MKCKRSFEIDEYLKNELDRNAKQDLEEHLKTCKDCLSEVDSLKSISAKLARLKVPDPGDLYFRNNLIKISGSLDPGERSGISFIRPVSSKLWPMLQPF